MKKFIKFLIILLTLTIIAIVVFLIIKLNKEDITVSENIENTVIEQKKENALVIDIGKKTEEEPVKEEPKQEPKKDAATITQEIYSLNSEIGTLYIPKTNLTTPIYCMQTSEKMEKMPCFIYATGELNEYGVVLITGHNKRNGKLFSNNKKLAEGDEFYFKDYNGKELKYTIYKKYITNSGDTSYLNIQSDKPIMALSCCTDANNDDRIIILGRAD